MINTDGTLTKMTVVLGMVINTSADSDTQLIASFGYEKLLDCGPDTIFNNLLTITVP